jgi:hypothetical protein
MQGAADATTHSKAKQTKTADGRPKAMSVQAAGHHELTAAATSTQRIARLLAESCAVHSERFEHYTHDL